MKGLKPRSREDRLAIAEALCGSFTKKFGDELLGVALTGSMARKDDRPYSDLEMIVFLANAPTREEDQYLQRIYDGLLIEVIYTTANDFLSHWDEVPKDWFLSGSAVLEPLYGASEVGEIRRRFEALDHPIEAYHRRAAERFLDVQESCGKLLSAVSEEDRKAIPVLFADAVTHCAATLSFVNQKPYTTLASMAAEMQGLSLQPRGLPAWMKIFQLGSFDDLAAIAEDTSTLILGFEALMTEQGIALYDETFDPEVPNRRFS